MRSLPSFRSLVFLSAVTASGALVGCSSAPPSDDDLTEAPAPEADTSTLASQSASWCRTPPPRTCDFYLSCLEVDRPCGAGGYAVSYGDKYCRRFLAETRLSPQGAAWRDATLSCLQYSLLPYLGSSSATCERIDEAAFDSHPGCYTQIGNSICDLPWDDWTIITGTVDDSDFYSLKSARQMYEVGTTCLGGWVFTLRAGGDAAGPAGVPTQDDDVVAVARTRALTPEQEDALRKIELLRKLGERVGVKP